MRTVIVSSAGAVFFLPYLEADLNIVGILDMRKSSDSKEAKERFLIRIFNRLKLIQICRLRLSHLTRKKSCRYIRIKNRSLEEMENRLIELKPDVVLAYRIPILNKKTLAIPRLGFINLHPSLLPRYRGGHPILWMAKDYDLQGGVTIHYMEEKEDRGPILEQGEFLIKPGASEEEVERQAVFQQGIPLSIQALKKLQSGSSIKIMQSETSPTPYAYRKKPEELWQMIDWQSWSLEHTWHMLRCHSFWKYKLPKMSGWRKWVDWRIGLGVTGMHDTSWGSVVADTQGYRIYHREGWIEVRPSVRFKRIMRKLLS